MNPKSPQVINCSLRVTLPFHEVSGNAVTRPRPYLPRFASGLQSVEDVLPISRLAERIGLVKNFKTAHREIDAV